jgi:hypothetical protein
MRERKPIPKNALEISQEQINPYLSNLGKPVSEQHAFAHNRGTDYSAKNEKVKDISIGLEDIDNAIMYYFDNYIKPTVIQDNNRMAVRTIYGSPERWKSIQADGFYRDGNGHVILPLIVIKRDNVEKTRGLGNKIDGNTVALYQTIGSSYNARNAYDKFDVVNNRIPSKRYYLSTVPDYVTLTYSCIIFTNFVEQNNKIVEAIEFASDSYWGDPARFKFRASIDSFATTVSIENGADRIAKSTFNIKVSGYIIPDTINRDLATIRNKFYTRSQVIFDLEVIDTAGVVTNVDRLKFANKELATNSAGSTSFIGGGINVLNSTFISPNLNTAEVAYLNTNTIKTANTVTTSTAIFTSAALLQPPVGSLLPPTSVNNFAFFVNGINVGSSLVTITEAGGNVTLSFNTAGMGYILSSTDEVIAVGKFQ